MSTSDAENSTAYKKGRTTLGRPRSLGSGLPLPPLKLLSRELAAASLCIGVRFLDELSTTGKISFVRIGDRKLYRPEDLDAFIDSLAAQA